MKTRTAALLTLCSGFALAPAAHAQTLLSEPFNDGPGSFEGNCEYSATGGNPGGHMYVPYLDFWGLTLRTSAANALTGNLARHGGALRLSVDIQVLQLNNWFGDPMDPNNFPVVFQFVDATDPIVSVYFTGPGMPGTSQGWTGFTCEIPDPTSATLPPGWGGTGDEDPVTFEPILPAGRTYASVMQNVGEVRITTMQPGYFYVSSFWEAGWDNVRLELTGGGTTCYANCDESTAAPTLNVADFTCFLQRFAAGEGYANCDESTVAPVLNVADFTCFLQRFAQGCP
jgi:hypothetical protein